VKYQQTFHADVETDFDSQTSMVNEVKWRDFQIPVTQVNARLRNLPFPASYTSCYKKLIRRWDSERKLCLRRHRTHTTKYNRLVHKFRQRSTRLLCIVIIIIILFNDKLTSATSYNAKIQK